VTVTRVAVCPCSRAAWQVAAGRRRNIVERCFNQLKRFRGIATRDDKLAEHYQAAINIASPILWLNQDPQNRP
jgi:transposase